MENWDTERLEAILDSLSKGVDDRGVKALSDLGARVFHLRGDVLTSKDAFLDQIARLMEFPDYFGRNWDALEDCLTDLAWIDASAVVLVLDKTDRFARSHPEDWRIALDVLRSAEAYWKASGPPAFHVVLVKGRTEATTE